jgi:hypothetical protein
VAGGPNTENPARRADEPMAPHGSLSVAISLLRVATDRTDQRFSVPSHVLSRSVGDDTVLLDLHQDEYFSLGHVGTKVWAMIVDGTPLGSIVDQIGEQYGVERERVDADVRALVDDLVITGLLAEA